MYESILLKIAVYKSRNGANRPETEPQPDELGLVLEVHRDNLVLLDMHLFFQPSRIFEGKLVCLAIRPFRLRARIAFVLRHDQEKFVGLLWVFGELFESIEDIDLVLLFEAAQVGGVLQGSNDAPKVLRDLVSAIEVCCCRCSEGRSRGCYPGEAWQACV